MFRLFQFLIFGHIHDWETIEKRNLEDEGKVVGQTVYLRCKKCGVFKRQTLGGWW